MSEEQNSTDSQQELKKDIRDYIEKRVELFVITISEQISLMIAHSIQRIIGILILAIALCFGWLALGLFIGELLNSYSAGFAISSVPLFIIGFMFLNRKSKKMTEKIQAGLIEKILENFDTDNGKNSLSKTDNE